MNRREEAAADTPRLSREQALEAFDALTREAREAQAARRTERADKRARHRLSRMPFSWVMTCIVLGMAPGVIGLKLADIDAVSFFAMVFTTPLALALGQRIWRHRLRA